MKAFLDQIWGNYDSGFRCVVSGQMKHNFYTGNDVKIPKGKDVWYAPSIFSIEERKITNVLATKAFWLDIDIKDKPNAYTDIYDAVAAVDTLVKAYALPVPTIIQSGNGLHIYWILNTHVTPDKWHPVAKALREACVEQNVLADHGITIDIARILRVPGSFNLKDKDNPKPVQLLNEITTCTYEELNDALADFAFKVELKREAAKTNAVFAIELPQTPKDANKIAEQCSQVKHFRDSRGNLPEPEWYAGLGVLALCVDGERIAHEWSSGHPDYSEAGTSSKFERAKEFAPTTCNRFQEVAPEKCKGCPFLGTITTPVQLGETMTPIQFPVKNDFPEQESQPKQEIEIREGEDTDLPIPKGYLVGEEGVRLMPGEEGEPPKWVFRFQPLWVSRLLVGEAGLGSEIEISWIDANKQLQTDYMKFSTMSVESQLAAWLFDHGIYGMVNIKLANAYLKDGVACIANSRGQQVVYDKFGLNKKGFLVGTDLITTTGKEVARVSGSIDARRVAMMTSTGSLDKWVKVTALLDKPHWWMHRFAVLAGLASPLLVLANLQGSILSLAGDSSGGKTTSANFGVSAFGHPEAFTVDPKSTLNAFYEHWRQVGNLPIILNEAGTIKREILSYLVYAAANGKARDGLRQDRTMVNSGSWTTLTIFTTNTHMSSMPDSVIGEGERRRIFEVTFDQENLMDEPTGKQLSQAAKTHHGISGRILLEYYMRYREAVSERIHNAVSTLQKGIGSAYRFNIWLIAAVYVAAEISTELELIQFGFEDVIQNSLRSLQGTVAQVVSPVQRVSELIDEWTTIYQSNIGSYSETTNIFVREPMGEARGRWLVRAEGTKEKKINIAIPTKRFRSFALENGVDANHIKRFIAERGATTKQVRLASYANAVQCYVIPKEEGDE